MNIKVLGVILHCSLAVNLVKYLDERKLGDGWNLRKVIWDKDKFAKWCQVYLNRKGIMLNLVKTWIFENNEIEVRFTKKGEIVEGDVGSFEITFKKFKTKEEELLLSFQEYEPWMLVENRLIQMKDWLKRRR